MYKKYLFFALGGSRLCGKYLWLGHKRKVWTSLTYPIDRLWTACEIDKKKQFTPLAVYVYNSSIYDTKGERFFIPISLMNCPDSSMWNMLNVFLICHVVRLRHSKFKNYLANSVLFVNCFCENIFKGLNIDLIFIYRLRK